VQNIIYKIQEFEHMIPFIQNSQLLWNLERTKLSHSKNPSIVLPHTPTNTLHQIPKWINFKNSKNPTLFNLWCLAVEPKEPPSRKETNVKARKPNCNELWGDPQILLFKTQRTYWEERQTCSCSKVVPKGSHALLFLIHSSFLINLCHSESAHHNTTPWRVAPFKQAVLKRSGNWALRGWSPH